MKKLIATAISLVVLAAAIGGGLFAFGNSSAEAKEGPKDFVVKLAGTANGVTRIINTVTYECYDVQVFDPSTGKVIGPGTDCLELGSIVPIPDGPGFAITNLTFFDLPGGTLVTLGRTAIQPVVPGSTGAATHITGETNVEDNIVQAMGTGRFAGATGNTVLKGAVDLSSFGGPGTPITFDCLFVIHVN